MRHSTSREFLRQHPAGAELDWTRAGIVMGVSDARGAWRMEPDGEWQDNHIRPSRKCWRAKPALPLAYFGVRVSELAQPNSTFSVTANLRFSGAQRLAVLAYGKSTHFTAEGDWPSPGFDGGFLPVKRTLSQRKALPESGPIPFIARGIPAEGHQYRGQRTGSHSDGNLVHRNGGPVSICQSFAQICTFVYRIIVSLVLCF